MPSKMFGALAALALLIVPAGRAIGAVQFDWTTEPAESDFHGLHSASTTSGDVTISATMLGAPANLFRADGFTVGLGASGTGGPAFDGEPGFTFSFNHQGILNSLTLVASGAYILTLQTPHNGSLSFQDLTSPFELTLLSGANIPFAAGEQFTLQHGGGSYQIGTIAITSIPEPGTVVSWALILIGTGAATLVWRRPVSVVGA